MAWPRDAYVGQKVVAVYRGVPEGKLRTFWRRLTGANDPYFLSEGYTYTITKLGLQNGSVRVFVAERPANVHYGFRCFRPVEPTKSKRTTKTGMRIFTDLLNTTPVRKHEKEDV